MSNKLSSNMKNGTRAAVDTKKAAEAASAKERFQQQREKMENSRLYNWKYVTGINFVIAAVFLGLAVYRFTIRASAVNITVLAVFGLLNLACAVWNLIRFRKEEK